MAHEARALIDLLIQQSLAHVKETVSDGNSQRGRFIELENDARTSEHVTVQWPKIAEFVNEHVGVEKINEYIEKVSYLRLLCHALRRKVYNTERREV